MKSLIALAFWNLIVFCLFGVDKYCALRRRRRISERCMIATSLFFGGAGAVCGMIIFNHKTRKKRFKITAIIASFIFVILLWYILKRAYII